MFLVWGHLTHILWKCRSKARNEVEHYKLPGCWAWCWRFKDGDRGLTASEQAGRETMDRMQALCSLETS